MYEAAQLEKQNTEEQESDEEWKVDKDSRGPSFTR
jgi:hypothetical protein